MIHTKKGQIRFKMLPNVHTNKKNFICTYYRRKKFLYLWFKTLLNLKYWFCNLLYEYFRFTTVRSTKIILCSWRKFCFHFVKSFWKKMLQVLSEDLLIFVFDWWDLASELGYEKVQVNFITLLKSLFGIFYDHLYDLTVFYTIFNWVSWILV